MLSQTLRDRDKMLKLCSVYEVENAPLYLYALLCERPAQANISHRGLPTASEHLAFVQSKPYEVWYLVLQGKEVVGSVYITRQREVGIFIFQKHQRHGYAKRAIELLRKKHPGKLYANVAPGNDASAALFHRLGFRHVQNTYAL